MKYPAFIDEVPKIMLYDPLAEFLGTIEDGIIEYSYLDATITRHWFWPRLAPGQQNPGTKNDCRYMSKSEAGLWEALALHFELEDEKLRSHMKVVGELALV
jgi:hypothetical protein